jgi:hypothetical protein
MLFDLNFPCYLTTFSGKKCISGTVICAFFCPAYRSSPVFKLNVHCFIKYTLTHFNVFNSVYRIQSIFIFTILTLQLYRCYASSFCTELRRPSRRYPDNPAYVHQRSAQTQSNKYLFDDRNQVGSIVHFFDNPVGRVCLP